MFPAFPPSTVPRRWSAFYGSHPALSTRKCQRHDISRATESSSKHSVLEGFAHPNTKKHRDFSDACGPCKNMGGPHLDMRNALIPPQDRRPQCESPVNHTEEAQVGSHQGQAASATRPLMIKPSCPAATRTISPSWMAPSRINPASGFCSCRWMTRFSGRAP